MKIKVLLIILCVFILDCSSKSQSISNDQLSFGISFPPVSDVQQRNFTAPLLDELNVNYIRIGENWKFREPTQGNFNWQPLDDRINWAAENGLKVLLTIQSNGPDWACTNLQNTNSCVFTNNQNFKTYIETLLQRYPNQIAKIQFGNEWQTNFWYIGSGTQFVAVNNIVYDAIAEFSPETTFVLGGFTTISQRFLAGCDGLVSSFFDDEGNLYDEEFLQANCNSDEIQSVVTRINTVLDQAHYDEVDIHLYDDAEQWSQYFEIIQRMTNKPIIVTEFGGPNVNIEPQTEAYQAQRLQVYLETLSDLNISEAYYFKLVEGGNNPAHSKSGLIDNQTLNKKQSFFTFKEFND